MIVYIDMDDVLSDYTTAFNNAVEETPGIAFPQSQYGFYANLAPITEAIESVNILINSEKFDPYILTAPSTRNPFSYTEKRVWVERYFGIEFTEKLIISPNKGLLKGDILIDDLISGRGQESFEGKIMQFGSVSYPGWKTVMVQLENYKL
jgi:5'(3')-deoxyribonucleotidase